MLRLLTRGLALVLCLHFSWVLHLVVDEIADLAQLQAPDDSHDTLPHAPCAPGAVGCHHTTLSALTPATFVGLIMSARLQTKTDENDRSPDEVTRPSLFRPPRG